MLVTIASLMLFGFGALAAAPILFGSRVNTIEYLLPSQTAMGSAAADDVAAIRPEEPSLAPRKRRPDVDDASTATAVTSRTTVDRAGETSPYSRTARDRRVEVGGETAGTVIRVATPESDADGIDSATGDATTSTTAAPSCDDEESGSGDGPVARGAAITEAYCSVLGRPPDREGLAYWTAQLGNGVTTDDLNAALRASPEYVRRVGADQSPITTIHRPGSSIAAAPPPSGPEALRRRTPIGQDSFARRVDTLGFDDRTWITDSLVHGWWFGGRQRIHVAMIHLSGSDGIRVSPGDRARTVVGSWAEEIGAHVAVNGNWFSPWDGPAVSGGRAYAGDDHPYTALFGFTSRLDSIVQHHRAINPGVDPRVVEGVSGHPTLIHRGIATTDFGRDPTFVKRHPRTAIGLDDTGDILVLVTVDGRTAAASGMTGAETTQLMQRLGAHDSVMLDGGGSSAMWIRGKGIVNQPAGGPRAVGNQIAVFG